MERMEIESLCWELKSLMSNNFSGTPKQRFTQAKKEILESVKSIIDENKDIVIKEFRGEEY